MSDAYEVDFDTLAAQFGLDVSPDEPAQPQAGYLYAPPQPSSQSRFAFNVDESEPMDDREAQESFPMRMPVASASSAAPSASYATPPSQRTPFFASQQQQQQQPSHSRMPYFAHSQQSYQSSATSAPSFMNSTARAGPSRTPREAPASQQQRFQEVVEPSGDEHDMDSASTNTGRSRVRNQHGTQLRPVSLLPDQYRALFRFPAFNAVQSKVYDTAINTDASCVVSAPTGAGKTAIFELAIIRMLQSKGPNAKAVYVAPTKALCAERARDWSARMQHIGCSVAEVTGDTGFLAQGIVKSARVIITTPEKWDSITRRWNDNQSILKGVSLMLIDEIHILREPGRGARVEVIVSRMKTYGKCVRFMALSATVPNAKDIAEWIGGGDGPSNDDAALSLNNASAPAKLFQFGEEYRACPLQRFVYGYANPRGEIWSFMSNLNHKLMGLIQQHSKGKPTLIFVPTRKATSQAAEVLAKEYEKLVEKGEALPWERPAANLAGRYQDKKLRQLASLGIAFHHAGLDVNDRRAVEKSFLNGEIGALCSTSSLAVGVNLPAYLVIIRGTQKFDDGHWVEISDLDLLQAMGRAGRPSFDTEGVACVLTEQQHRERWAELAQGATVIESVLHHELVEHINAEVGLRGGSDVASIRRWLASTYLQVRLRKNPTHYAKIVGGEVGQQPQIVMENICAGALSKLDKHELIERSDTANATPIQSTELGKILSQYFLNLNTVLKLCEIKPNSSVKVVLTAICEAQEFGEIRFRQGEKAVYNKLRTHQDIRFPPAKINSPVDKCSLLLQATLAGLPLSEVLKTDDQVAANPFADVFLLFRHASRILKALFDIACLRRDGGTAKATFELLRSISGKAWDGSCVTLRQLPNIGEKSLRVLASAGISSMQKVAETEPHRIELLLNRKEPFGSKTIAAARALPAFTLSIEEADKKKIKEGVGVTVRVSVGLKYPGTVREKSAVTGQAYCISCLAITSDNEYIDFRRMRVSKIGEGKSYKLHYTLSRPSQKVVVIVGCDEVAGSALRAEISPNVEASAFPLPSFSARAESLEEQGRNELEGLTAEDFGSVELDDESDEVPLAVLLQREGEAAAKKANEEKASTSAPAKRTQKTADTSRDREPDAPAERLPNGNYKCGHNCKKECRHLCCREGMPNPPRGRKPAASGSAEAKSKQSPEEKLSLIEQVARLGKKSKEGSASTSVSAASQPSKAKVSQSKASGSSSSNNKGMETLDELHRRTTSTAASTAKTSAKKRKRAASPKYWTSSSSSSSASPPPPPKELLQVPPAMRKVPPGSSTLQSKQRGTNEAQRVKLQEQLFDESDDEELLRPTKQTRFDKAAPKEREMTPALADDGSASDDPMDGFDFIEVGAAEKPAAPPYQQFNKETKKSKITATLHSSNTREKQPLFLASSSSVERQTREINEQPPSPQHNNDDNGGAAAEEFPPYVPLTSYAAPAKEDDEIGFDESEFDDWVAENVKLIDA